jgi:hypothetical protein
MSPKSAPAVHSFLVFGDPYEPFDAARLPAPRVVVPAAAPEDQEEDDDQDD